MPQEILSVLSNGSVCVPLFSNSYSNHVTQYLQSQKYQPQEHSPQTALKQITLPSASLPTVISIHHYGRGLLYLSVINSSQLHMHHTDIPTCFNLIMSILHLHKNVYFNAQKDLLLLTNQSALTWEAQRLPHTPTLHFCQRSH